MSSLTAKRFVARQSLSPRKPPAVEIELEEALRSIVADPSDHAAIASLKAVPRGMNISSLLRDMTL